jgi:hypothetical protein
VAFLPLLKEAKQEEVQQQIRVLGLGLGGSRGPDESGFAPLPFSPGLLEQGTIEDSRR